MTRQASFKGRFEPELTLLIHTVLYKLSVWNKGATYGAKLQDLRYTIPSKPGAGGTSRMPPDYVLGQLD